MRLIRLLVDHAPAATSATHALAALMYLGAARLPGRINELGELTVLAEQDRSRWDASLIAEGLALLERSATGTELSVYHIEATIAGLHASARRAADTQWAEIVGLYELHLKLRPSPVVALNRAMAVAELEGPAAGLAAIAAIPGAERLRDYPFHAAALGELELRRGNRDVAARAFSECARPRAQRGGARVLGATDRGEHRLTHAPPKAATTLGAKGDQQQNSEGVGLGVRVPVETRGHDRC